MRGLGIWGLVVLAMGLAGAAPLPAPVFAPRPRVACTAAELARWKADPARADEVRALLARGDALLKAGPLAVPQREGQWIFYYACPKCDAGLTSETPERHVCPRCGAVYTDERTCAAYRTQLNYQLDNDCLALATCRALTGDDRYAAPVRAALLELARLYPTFERHDRWGRRGLLAVVGGRRYCQLLDEAVALIALAKTYDYLADSPVFSAADRAAIEEKLLGDNAREILKYQAFAGSRNNHQTWFNAAYANVGLAIGDAALLREAIEGSAGLRWQLEHSVTSDGLWYEGTIAYHFYALQAIEETLAAAKHAGWDLRDDPRVKSLWLGPVQLAYPDGRFPVMHDSDPVSLEGYRPHFRWALDYFADPVFAPYAGGTGGAPPTGADLAGIGLAVLRRGANPDAACAMIDYGQHGDSHGHPDKLNLVLYGLGRELLLDPGRISYSVPEYQSWCRTTVAHNTVTVNGKNQQPDTGRCLFFADAPGYAAAFTASDGAYPGVALRRFVLLADGVLVDVFAVRGTAPAQLDWLAHLPGALALTPPPAPRAAPLGAENGYQHLAKLMEGPGAARLVGTATVEGGRPLKLWCIDDADSTLVTGEGIGYNLSQRAPFLLRRRTAAATVFITLYDLSGDGSAIAAVERVPVRIGGREAGPQEACALRVRSAAGASLLVALDLRDAAKGKMTVGKTAVARCAVVRTPAPAAKKGPR